MTRTKESARRGKSHNKRPNPNSRNDNSQDAPRAKKARPNPPSSKTPSNKMSNATKAGPSTSATARLNPTSIPAPSSLPLQVPSSNADSPVDLSSTHDLTSMSILSSTQIQKKVTGVLELLSVYPTPQGEKPKVVELKAKAGAATKMISIVEIAKREIAKEGKWYQYNCVECVMEEVKPKISKVKEPKDVEEGRKVEKEGDAGDKEQGEEDSEDETTAFETMKTPWERANEGKAKIRAVPVMRIYLSRVRIESLRKAYGEQTNALQTA